MENLVNNLYVYSFPSGQTSIKREREREREREKTLLTRIVPAKPLRPAMPRGGGNAQSSPTITVCKGKEVSIFLFYSPYNASDIQRKKNMSLKR